MPLITRLLQSLTSASLLIVTRIIINNDAVVSAWSSSFTSFSVKKNHHSYRAGTLLRSSSSGTSSKTNDFNVVLRPSSTPDAFDSYKIGSPCVHRYNYNGDNTNSGEEVEYWMWYHGRSVLDAESKNLAPLSTGRVGLAFSRNGLHWVRQSENLGTSSEENMRGVTFGKNVDSWWSFDTAHVGLGQVLMPTTTPALAGNNEGGMYLMYYMGGSNEEQPISEYMPPSSDSNLGTVTVKGMRMKIGVALSQDGRTWGRVEGDDHTGAIMVPHDKSNADKNIRDSLEEELYVGWPDVIVVNDEQQKSQKFIMYYSTALKDSKQKCIGYAVSKDGFRWEKRGICLRPSAPLDVNGCARCHVSKRQVYNGESWVEDGGFIMLYEGIAEDGKHRILAAESNDGVKWEGSSSLVLDVGENGSWDEGGVGSPNILRLDDGSLRMYYVGQGLDGSTAIGVAKGYTDGGLFVREQAQLSFA